MKIAVIKLGARGDVLRTLPIIEAIKEKYPAAQLKLITNPVMTDILKHQPSIDELLTEVPLHKSFDILYNFDIDANALKLASSIKAKKKYGFYSNDRHLAAFNLGAEYYINTIFDDDLKKSNKKTYQEMMFEVAELPPSRKPYHIYLTQDAKEKAARFIAQHKLENKKIIGIHMGASPRWPSKSWSEEQLKNFIRTATQQYTIFLFGGPDEASRYPAFLASLHKEALQVFPFFSLPDEEFAAMISVCNTMICSDSYALHIALGLGKKTIALFFCTSPDEVEGYGLLKKMISPLLYDFFPERQDQFSKELVNSIRAQDVVALL